VWFADAGWWIAVVELQPSSWSRGSYLNVGAMWLVYPLDHVAFHDGHRQQDQGFVEFKDADRFEHGVRGLCSKALDVVADLRGSIRSYADAKARQERLLIEEDGRAGPPGPWNAYYAAAFALLSGDRRRADELAGRLEAYPATWDWEIAMKETALATLRSDRAETVIGEHVARTRAALRLPERPLEGEWKP
jgi:hypothetical protein